MKSAIFAAVALAVPAVYTQMIPGLPACADPCVTPNSVSISGCTSMDYKCICSSKPYILYAADCFEKSCTDQLQLQSAANAAHRFCQSHGVDLSTVVPEGPTTDIPEGPTTDIPEGPTTDTTKPTTTPMMPPTMMPPPPTETPMMPPPLTPTGVTTPTANVSTPFPTSTTETTTTIYGTGSSVTVIRNITTPTVVPPDNNQSAAVKNIAGLGAIVMVIAGFFAL